MIIKTTRTALYGAVSLVKKTTPGQSSYPALSCILFDGHADGRLTLTGTDGDTTLTAEIKCDIQEPCKAAIPAGLLCKLLFTLPEGAVELIYDPALRKATVKSSVGRTNIACIDEQHFPKPAPDGECIKCSIPTKALCEMLRKTSYAITPDILRKVLRNILMHITQDEITMVATNERLCAEVKHGIESSDKFEDIEILLPATAYSLLEDKATFSQEGNVTISIPKEARTHATFTCGDTTLRTKLYDDVFPNYKAVIPAESETPAIIDRKRLIEAIERASIFSPNGEGGYVALTLSANALTVESQRSDNGDSREVMPIKYSGETITVLVAKRYINPILRAIDDDEACAHIKSSNAAILITCSEQYVAVLMPVRA